MTSDKKITIIFWLLVAIVSAEVIKAGYDVHVWFQRRFVESGNSMRYSK